PTPHTSQSTTTPTPHSYTPPLHDALPISRVQSASEDTNDADRLEIDALARNIKTNFQQVVSLSPLLSDDLQTLATNIDEPGRLRSEEHTSELQSRVDLVCRLLLEKKKKSS